MNVNRESDGLWLSEIAEVPGFVLLLDPFFAIFLPLPSMRIPEVAPVALRAGSRFHLW